MMTPRWGNPELKPCPFCGCPGTDLQVHEDGVEGWAVYCDSCTGGCNATGGAVLITGWSWEQVRDAWNHRPCSQADREPDGYVGDEWRQSMGRHGYVKVLSAGYGADTPVYIGSPVQTPDDP